MLVLALKEPMKPKTETETSLHALTTMPVSKAETFSSWNHFVEKRYAAATPMTAAHAHSDSNFEHAQTCC